MLKGLLVIFFFFSAEISSILSDVRRSIEIDEEFLVEIFRRKFEKKIDFNKEFSREKRNRVGMLPSLTLLMNFRDDGTTSLQILRGNESVYTDNGFCKYGQLFDPTVGRCRDIFCQELNFRFNGTACVSDGSQNSSGFGPRMSDIEIFLPSTISLADPGQRQTFSVHLHSRMNQTCTKDWTTMLHQTLQKYVQVDLNRFEKIRICPRDKNDQRQIRPECSPTTSLKFLNDGLARKESVELDIFLSITDRNETSTDFRSNFHITSFLGFAVDNLAVIDLCQNYSIKFDRLAVISDRNRARQEFCPEPSKMNTINNGRLVHRLNADGQIDYVVEVPELETTYEMGDFTFTFLFSTATQGRSDDNQNMLIDSTARMINVCNRYPRIVGRCPDGQVMRIATCEIISYKNNSVRIKRTGKLYTNREYRIDEFRAENYIVVCKNDVHNSTSIAKIYGFLDKAPGFLSTIGSIFSIFALTFTLLTFLLFSSLRNLPGCNTINLIVALGIAQILFLCQSLFIMTWSSVCLMFAIGIHFFYLASFFWMNVMAFDLWKTFHKGFSLYLHDIRERLPYYSLYAWGTPLLIVVIGIILDAVNSPVKPCYGRFFRGCYDVCFRTKNDISLQGCWIESALMRLILFGCPVAIILMINFVFYALTVRGIRRATQKARIQVERKFQRKKQVVPGEHDVKIYMRMAVLAGFGWTIGFILLVLPDGEHGFKRYLNAIFKCLFVLLNATPGIFIFAVYVCNRRVCNLYQQLFRQILQILSETCRNSTFLSSSRLKNTIGNVRRFVQKRQTNQNIDKSILNQIYIPSSSEKISSNIDHEENSKL